MENTVFFLSYSGMIFLTMRKIIINKKLKKKFGIYQLKQILHIERNKGNRWSRTRIKNDPGSPNVKYDNFPM